jgi:surface antigen
MSSVMVRIAVIAAIGAALCGCASGGGDYYGEPRPQYPSARVASTAPLPAEHGSNHVQTVPGQNPLQCAPYAREHSQVKIFGDAYTWWNQALGKYERGPSPAAGTVMVLANYAGPERGHVAVVKKVVSAREIRVDHANWLDDGAIYVNDPVVDVSSANDWSQVRVWNIKTGGWGGKIYPVQGFIGEGSDGAPGATRPEETSPDDARPQERAPDSDEAPDADAAPGLLAAAPAPMPARPRPARTAPNPFMTVNASAADLNPPADSPHALSAEDLALP